MSELIIMCSCEIFACTNSLNIGWLKEDFSISTCIFILGECSFVSLYEQLLCFRKDFSINSLLVPELLRTLFVHNE